ncbi:6-hydroxymethylpterin diphosphokinase MptE-like protein [uncultured Methanofollis sp.]|uniref:6-hydroxymethylpterin diphosphokinase MptE-like protein n=1 Tax=uncultured Methanofollis sp. TaxID=262500 RepID=UPI00261B69B7|nr:6-hydroxymethylpterin diphosphokinase MptE-like protein [uncultured Methanofollis sp.]
MKFEEWEPLYEEILDYFAFDRAGDEEAARLLASILPHDDLAALEALCRGKTVTVCGNAPSLPREIGGIEGTVFAADAAADVLYARGIRPDAVFTDLDGATDALIEMNREGTVVVVHAHGDNIPLLRHWVLKLPGPLVGTTQAAPFGRIHNFGGFSDGDRAAFAAHALGAVCVSLVGFDLDDPGVDPVKRGKLAWARRLLAILGHDI